MVKFYLVISKNENFLSRKSELKLPIDLELTEIIKNSVPKKRPRKRKRVLDKSKRLDIVA